MEKTFDVKTLEDNLFLILKPAVERIDSHVGSVRNSQVELREKIDCVALELRRISEEQPVDVDLEPYVRRLISTKRRVILISNIIQNVQDRLNRLYRSVEVETARKQALVQAQNALIDVSQPPKNDGT